MWSPWVVLDVERRKVCPNDRPTHAVCCIRPKLDSVAPTSCIAGSMATSKIPRLAFVVASTAGSLCDFRLQPPKSHVVSPSTNLPLVRRRTKHSSHQTLSLLFILTARMNHLSSCCCRRKNGCAQGQQQQTSQQPWRGSKFSKKTPSLVFERRQGLIACSLSTILDFV